MSIPALLVIALVVAWVVPALSSIVDLRVTPTVISPNGDGARDQALVTWSIADSTASDLLLTIRKSGGTTTAIARQFRLGPRPVGPDQFLWDGTDSLGSLVPDTLYSVQLTQFNGVGAVIADARVTVRVDVTPPPAPTTDTPDTTVTDSLFKFEGFAAGADSVILFRSGVPIDTVGTSGDPLVYSFSVALIEGLNRLSVQAFDRGRNFSPQTPDVEVLYLNAADVAQERVFPNPFSPNGDGVRDTTRVSFLLDAPTGRLEVTVRRGTFPTATTPADFSQPVAVVFDAPAAKGKYSIPWDGRDSLGTFVGDGAYFFKIHADSVDAMGTTLPAAGSSYVPFTVDNTPPAVPQLLPPPPPRTIRSTLPLTIQLILADSVRVYRDGILIATIPSGAPNGFAKVQATVPLRLGTNEITLQAFDSAGNLSPIAGPFIVFYEAPIGFHAPERFTGGDAFDVNLTTPASSVVIELFTLRGEPVRRLVSTASTTRYEVVWDLKDTFGRFVGDGPYLARLRVTYPDGTGTEQKAAIVVVK